MTQPRCGLSENWVPVEVDSTLWPTLPDQRVIPRADWLTPRRLSERRCTKRRSLFLFVWCPTRNSRYAMPLQEEPRCVNTTTRATLNHVTRSLVRPLAGSPGYPHAGAPDPADKALKADWTHTQQSWMGRAPVHRVASPEVLPGRRDIPLAQSDTIVFNEGHSRASFSRRL
jgi:hypothetical protein